MKENPIYDKVRDLSMYWYQKLFGTIGSLASLSSEQYQFVLDARTIAHGFMEERVYINQDINNRFLDALESNPQWLQDLKNMPEVKIKIVHFPCIEEKYK
jgi:hypothetical protein